VQVIFVDNCEKVNDLEKYLVAYQVQYNNDDKFLWLAEYLNDLHFDSDQKDKFTYYRMDNRLSPQEFRGMIHSEIQDKQDQECPELEIRAYPLQDLLDQDDRVYFTDLFYPRSVLLVVRNEHSQPFTLKAVALDLQKDPELCEYCDEREALKIACPCKQAFYCSIKCRIKNMNYHKKTCPYAYDVEPLLELMPEYEPQEEFNYETGLINIGNSCYMASVLQVLRLYPDFYLDLKTLNREEMRKLNRENLNVFPYLEEAVNRMNWSGESTYAPYLLKAAIGIKNNNVVGGLLSVRQIQPKRCHGVLPKPYGDHQRRREEDRAGQ
jgi:hypothetical protein